MIKSQQSNVGLKACTWPEMCISEVRRGRERNRCKTVGKRRGNQGKEMEGKVT